MEIVQMQDYFLIKLSSKTYLTGICYDLNNTEGELNVVYRGCAGCSYFT